MGLDEANMLRSMYSKWLKPGCVRQSRSGKRFLRDKKGVTAIEFAAIAPVFFFMMGSLMETGVMLFTEYVLQTSVQDAARLVRTGQAQTSSMTETQFKQEICNSATVIPNCMSNVTVNMVARNSFSDLALAVPAAVTVGSGYGGTSASPSYTCGGASQAVALIATYDWNFTLPLLEKHFGNVDGDKRRRLAGIHIFMNEPFPSTGLCSNT
jgi:Flp pilus assembly protein TadG